MGFNKRRHTLNYIKNPGNPLRQPVGAMIDTNKQGSPPPIHLTKPILSQSKKNLLAQNSSKFLQQNSTPLLMEDIDKRNK
jgi:hypothetical protein